MQPVRGTGLGKSPRINFRKLELDPALAFLARNPAFVIANLAIIDVLELMVLIPRIGPGGGRLRSQGREGDVARRRFRAVNLELVQARFQPRGAPNGHSD